MTSIHKYVYRNESFLLLKHYLYLILELTSLRESHLMKFLRDYDIKMRYVSFLFAKLQF